LWIYDFIGLVFPRICAGCGNNLWRHEKVLCGFCLYHLPKSGFHLDNDNPVSRLFWGRERIDQATAFLIFNKGSKVQHLIHQLKYKGKKEIGTFLGKLYGEILKDDIHYKYADYIIPVPLHKKKYMQRGYNQSEVFGMGLSDSMRIPVNHSLLLRSSNTGTQTRKSRFNRYLNVNEIFILKNSRSFENKYLLLVDDVVTTGATLESCIHTLNQIPGVRVGVVCIAAAII